MLRPVSLHNILSDISSPEGTAENDGSPFLEKFCVESPRLELERPHRTTPIRHQETPEPLRGLLLIMGSPQWTVYLLMPCCIPPGFRQPLPSGTRPAASQSPRKCITRNVPEGDRIRHVFFRRGTRVSHNPSFPPIKPIYAAHTWSPVCIR